MPLGTIISGAVSTRRHVPSSNRRGYYLLSSAAARQTMTETCKSLGRSSLGCSCRQTFSKFGFTNENHCLMQPSTSRPLSFTSRNTNRRGLVSGSATEVEDMVTYTVLIGTYRDRPRRKSTPETVSPRLGSLRGERCGYLHVKQLQNPGVVEREYAL